MFTETRIPIIPTVTIPLSQFNLMKRALRAASMFREHQLEGGKITAPSPSEIKDIQKDLDRWRDLELDLNSEY